jgi:hypothetical protein
VIDPIPGPDQTVGVQRGEERPKVGLAPFWDHVELVDDEVAELGQRPRLLKQTPNPCPDQVETVVNACVEVKDNGFAAELAVRVVLESLE